jgi:MFS-type transporter involved in bile tolerance (Atg22 family)
MEYLKQKVKKNVLDIEHQKYLTYFNITAVFVVTSIFTTVLSFVTEKINFIFFLYLFLIIVSVGFSAGFIFRKKMDKKLDEIRKL